jgi:hypothetical protein
MVLECQEEACRFRYVIYEWKEGVPVGWHRWKHIYITFYLDEAKAMRDYKITEVSARRIWFRKFD